MLVNLIQLIKTEIIFNPQTKSFLGENFGEIKPTNWVNGAENISIQELGNDGVDLVRIKDASSGAGFNSNLKYWYRDPNDIIKTGEASPIIDVPSKFALIKENAMSKLFKIASPDKLKCLTINSGIGFDGPFTLNMENCSNSGILNTRQLFEISIGGGFSSSSSSFYSSSSTSPISGGSSSSKYFSSSSPTKSSSSSMSGGMKSSSSFSSKSSSSRSSSSGGARRF